MSKFWARVACSAAVAALAAGCGQSKTQAGKAEAETPAVDEIAPIDIAEAGVASAAERAKLAGENLIKAEKFLDENTKRDGVKVTASGLQYQILEEGPADGYQPKVSDIIDVHYVGTLIDGAEFDSSRARGAAARFPLGQVIPGWVEGLQLMSVGDKFRFFIPPSLAYGETGTPGGPIGPNEALIFDVELIKVTNPERNLVAAEAFLAENSRKPGVKTTASGLQYEVLVSGPADGRSPTDANIVRVNYAGTLTDGTAFDSSYDRGEPAEFPLAQVIPGWVEGVQLMRVGDKFRFFIPPDLAYGASGTPGGPIGPNEALIFEVELLEVKD